MTKRDYMKFIAFVICLSIISFYARKYIEVPFLSFIFDFPQVYEDKKDGYEDCDDIKSSDIHELVRYYKVVPYTPSMSKSTRDLMKMILEKRAEFYTDDYAISLEYIDTVPTYLVGVKLYFPTLNDVPCFEEKEDMFTTIISPLETKGYINYGKQNEEMVFDNEDLEFSYNVAGEGIYCVNFSLIPDDYEKIRKKIDNKEITLLMDGNVISMAKQNINPKTNLPINLFSFSVDSYKLMEQLTVAVQNGSLKYRLENIENPTSNTITTLR